jgi:hypothetical protein
MRTIVQYNRRHILAAAAAATAAATPCPPSGEQQQQQQQQQRPAVLVVGYVMKASREEQLASAGLLPLLPGDDGLCFMPFDVGQLTANDTATATATTQPQQGQQQQQGQCQIDVLLHKGSDELVAGPGGGVGWSGRLLALQQWLQQEQQRHICVVDPFENTAKVCQRLLHVTPSARVCSRPAIACWCFAAAGLSRSACGLHDLVAVSCGPFLALHAV